MPGDSLSFQDFGEMLNRRSLQRINERPRSFNRFPLIAIGAGSSALALVLALLLSTPLLALAVLAAGSLGVLGVYRSQRARMITALTYDLDAETGARFDGIQEALKSLASAEKVWRVDGRTGQRDRGRNPDAPSGIQAARVGRLKTPGIRTNIPIRGIDAGQKILFFPEAVLVLEEDYKPIPYESLAVYFSSERRLEEGQAPTDAEVIGRTWRYTRDDGSPDRRPDRRYASNPEVSVVLYGLLEISSPSGLEVMLLVSDKDAAARFARAFEAGVRARDTSEAAREAPPGKGPREKRAPRSAKDAEQEARNEAALRTLGVTGEASATEINAAYKEMARIYHPDKVANQSLEVQEYAEQRMKEINAAYTLLKRRKEDHAGGA